MRTVTVVIISAIISVIICSESSAEQRTFRTIPDDDANLVQFTSRAVMENVVGQTGRITGFVKLDPEKLTSTRDAQFDVDLNSLDTGNGMRNKDMRLDFLETAKYPTASFSLTRFESVDKPTLMPGDTVQAGLEGDFTVHGVTKPYHIPVMLILSDDHTLFVTGNWVVQLADHNISRPELLFMRLAEEQNIYISISLTDVASAEE